MIVINTKSGEHFINDKEVINLHHDVDESYVRYTRRADKNRFRINNVMAVTYISDTMQANLTFNGKELERIYADNADKKAKIDELEKRLHDVAFENENNKIRLENANEKADKLLANNQKLQHTNGDLTILMNTVICELQIYGRDANPEHLKKIYSAALEVESKINHPEK